ncbi:MAG: hypothetical protein QOK19_2491 [Solirubrobacteraceae bacterium]|nr:hypothetical protein [Solirubrobacteraceae bacterium]
MSLTIALAALLAGGTAVALGATGAASHTRHGHANGRIARGPSRHAGLLATASSYLGVPTTQMRSELASGKTLGQLAAATPGKSEAGLVAAILTAAKLRLHSASATLPARVESLVRGRPGRNAAARHGRVKLRAVTLSYLGIARKALLKQLHSGMTPAQVADATPGKSAAGLRAALLAAAKQQLDGKVAARVLSKGAEARRLAHQESKVDALLSRAHPGRALRARKPAA